MKNFQAKRWLSIQQSENCIKNCTCSRHLEIWLFIITNDGENRGKTLLTISSNDFIASIFRKGKNMVFRLEEVFRDDANELQKSSIFEYDIPIELLNNSRQEDPVLGADGYQGGFPVVREKNGGKINFQEINLINWSWRNDSKRRKIADILQSDYNLTRKEEKKNYSLDYFRTSFVKSRIILTFVFATDIYIC